MVEKLYIDLDDKYIEEKETVLRRLEEKYRIETGKDVLLEKADTVILTDRNSSGKKWEDYAVIGVEHSGRVLGTAYVVENLEDINCFDLELAYGRKFGIPCVIAANETFTLREMTQSDMTELKKIYDDGETEFIPGPGAEELETDGVQSYIRYMYGYYGYGLWVMEDNETGCLIGRAGIEHREIEGKTYCELAYLVRKEYRRKGYGFRAAEMVLEFARGYGMEELVAYINEKNIPSVKLSEKLGFARWKEITDGTEKYLVYRKEL